MLKDLLVRAPFGAFLLSLFFILPPGTVSAQSHSQPGGQSVSLSFLQSQTQHNVSPLVSASQPPVSSGDDQTAPPSSPQVVIPGSQGMHKPQQQREIPTVWAPTPQAPADVPGHAPDHTSGYLGVAGREFHRSRLCMHALNIHGVEITAIAPNSPAARAGLQTARDLSTRESVVAAVAGLLSLSPASSLAPSVVQAGGGVAHGDIILAVGGKRVKTEPEFQHAITRFGPGAIVYLTVRRGEAVIQIPVQLDQQPATKQHMAAFSH